MGDLLSNLTEEQRKLLEIKLREKKKAKLQNSETKIIHDESGCKKYSISYNQESIWFVNKLYKNNTIYNIGGIAHIKGPLRSDIFETCMQKLVDKYDILRTVFVEEGKEVFAKVIDNCSFNINRVDLSADNQNIKSYIENRRDTPFDLEKEPAYRVDVIKLSEDKWMILLVIHHLLTDGASTQIIFKELIDNYEGLTEGVVKKSIEPKINYGDFANWQKTFRNSLSDSYWNKFQIRFFQ